MNAIHDTHASHHGIITTGEIVIKIPSLWVSAERSVNSALIHNIVFLRKSQLHVMAQEEAVMWLTRDVVYGHTARQFLHYQIELSTGMFENYCQSNLEFRPSASNAAAACVSFKRPRSSRHETRFVYVLAELGDMYGYTLTFSINNLDLPFYAPEIDRVVSTFYELKNCAIGTNF